MLQLDFGQDLVK